MILEELFIDGQQVDIKDTSIVRRYQTPYFSDVTKLLSDTTYTITLPQTERNKAIMEYLHEADMNTDFPYTLHYADYYCEGLQLIRHGEVKVLGDFEIQIVYGIDRETIKLLFSTYLNEITTDNLIIFDDDWYVKWNANDMYAAGKQYQFADYVSLERESTINPTTGNKYEIPSPYTNIAKDMTLHPFIKYANLLLLIQTFIGCNIGVEDINTLLEDKGIILTGKERRISDINYERNITNETYSETAPTNVSLKLFASDYSDDMVVYDNTTSTRNISFAKSNLLSNESEIKIVLENILTEDLSGVYFQKYDNGNWVNITFVAINEPVAVNATFTAKLSEAIKFRILIDVATPEPGNPAIGKIISGKVKVQYTLKDSIFDTSGENGTYDCLYNLPKAKLIDILSDALKVTGLNYGLKNNQLTAFSLSDFKTNYDNGTVYDWSGRISNVKKSEYQFNSNAQRNIIKFNNSNSVNYENKGVINVNDLTLQQEKDLHNINYDIPFESISGLSEVILYKQKVDKNGDSTITFENDYSEKPIVFCELDTINTGYKNLPTATNVKASDIVSNFYSIYKKLVERPIVKEVNVLLDFYESANIDFTKPVYISEWGKYCMLLELTAPNKGLCEAKLLLINQTL